VKKITHSHIFRPFKRSFLSHALPCAVHFAPAFVGGLTDLGPDALPLVPDVARPRLAMDTPGKGREKGSPMAPPLAALLSGLRAC
jgi:hypothetical protein